MRHALALFSALAITMPSTSAAQVFDCFDCTLGIYDDPSLTTNFGVSVTGVPKVVYLGIVYAGVESRLTGVEFSIAGMRSDTDGIILIGVEEVPSGFPIGQLTVHSPADTSSTSTGRGGMNIAWSSCLVGDRMLARITFVHIEPAVNHVFQVKRKYPTSNSIWRTPILVRCDGPAFSAVRITGGCYMLNWNGDPNVPCAPVLIGVEAETWSSVKQLFR